MEARGASAGWRDAEPMVTRFKAESGRACEATPAKDLRWRELRTRGAVKRESIRSGASSRLCKAGMSRLLGAAEPAELHMLRDY